jgi:hypothetical protein
MGIGSRGSSRSFDLDFRDSGLWGAEHKTKHQRGETS